MQHGADGRRDIVDEVTTAKLSSLINASPPVCVALTTKGRAPRSLGKGPMRALTLP